MPQVSPKEAVLHTEAERAVSQLDKLIRRGPSAENLRELVHLLLEKQRRFVLYLGAGCSASVSLEDESWSGVLWNDLLWELVQKVLRKNPDFLAQLARRADPRQEESWPTGNEWKDKSRQRECLRVLQGYFDKLQLAGFISREFTPPGDRDKAIRALVEPESDERRSALFEELLRLPFKDIVTTNYDTNLRHFLGKREVNPIYGEKSLHASFNRAGVPRVVYLHGKIPESLAEGDGLVLDRFDYAQLMTRRDGLMDFVSVLLRDSNTLYIGFGLDDPSFNYVETRLFEAYNRHRPVSFAFVEAATEREHETWAERNLRLIELEDIENGLPEVIQSINTIIEYVQKKEPDRPPGASPIRDRTNGYLTKAFDSYLRGDFVDGWHHGQAALASAVLWEATDPDPKDPTRYVLAQHLAQRICEIRLRLALSHYKLRSLPDSGALHQEVMEHHLEVSDEILKSYRRIPKDSQGRQDWEPLRYSRRILQARRLYYEGKYKKALWVYEAIRACAQRSFTQRFETLEEETDASVLTLLRVAESYYYSECQRSRIGYQVHEEEQRPPEESHRRDSPHLARERRIAMRGDMAVLAGEIDALVDKLSDPDMKKRKLLGRLSYYRHSLHSLSLIARWTGGRHAVGVLPEVLPSRAQRSEEYLRLVREGIGDLRAGQAEGSEGIAAIGGGRGPSPRWEAMRLRYLARAHSAEWLIRSSLSGGTAGSTGLRTAFSFLQDAITCAAGEGLEEQQTTNCLEAARLNIMAIFGERIRGIPSTSPLTRTAAVYYLQRLFARLLSTPRDVANRLWMETLGYRAASYLCLITKDAGHLQAAVSNDSLSAFLSLALAEQVEFVVGKYTECGQVIGRTLETRIRLYEETFAAIAEELGIDL